ncbi:hypothetical protein [Burkholderia gladioli]|uniref:hypothetical protein n=1 Tax=Burkholderia gladioli TaxID=28095 RepID=UPI003B97EB70
MQTFLISYDLKTSNDDNAAVRKNLEKLGAKSVLESVWTYESQDDKLKVAEKVSAAMKKGDRFVVAAIDGEIVDAEAPFSTNKYIQTLAKKVSFL